MRSLFKTLFASAVWVLLGSCGGATGAAPGGAITIPPAAAAIPFDAHILVDQFGYRPGARKVAVVRDPRIGYDSDSGFVPGARYEVRRADNGELAHIGTLAPWRGGEVDLSAGDAGWWFDFTSLEQEGTYFVHDVERNVRSAPFRIDVRVYSPVLRAAVRTFYYQRSGFAKQAPWADACWADGAAFVGRGQDQDARDITDRQNKAKIRDVSGGWFDAGDTNKYVTFAAAPVHQLLSAYTQNPAVFTDDFGIPESGNGIPDLLDEVRWEIDWLKRMQFADGSVGLKVGTMEHTRGVQPSKDRNPRYYVPSCSSATIAAAGMFAHAGVVLRPFSPQSPELVELTLRAERAWQSFHASPRQVECDTGEVKAGDADWSASDQDAEAVVAAIYLFAMTGKPQYDEYVASHYRDTRPYRDIGWSRYSPHQGEALLFHARQPESDRHTSEAILADKRSDIAAGNQIYGPQPDADLYGAFMHSGQYHWGSNQVRANYGNSNVDAAATTTDSGAPAFMERAEGILHYFHGVNPFAMVYLTNMYAYGATRSANEIFHSWFLDGTRWDSAVSSKCGPPPGFVPGGPNSSAAEDGVPRELAPPSGQPPQKSYRDWNAGWPESSWVVTEPGIYYQAAYIKLLSAFAR